MKKEGDEESEEEKLACWSVTGKKIIGPEKPQQRSLLEDKEELEKRNNQKK